MKISFDTAIVRHETDVGSGKNTGKFVLVDPT